MRHLFTCVAAATTVALSLLGCGSDSDSGSSNHGGAGGGAGASAIAQCVGNNEEFTPAEFLAQTAPGKACSGSSDVSSVCANNLPVIGGTCGKSCLSAGDDSQQALCVAGCIQAALDDSKSARLSDECVTCYVTDIGCAKSKCLGQCAVDPASPACFTCRTDAGCVAAFYDCSGLPEPGASDGGGGEGGS